MFYLFTLNIYEHQAKISFEIIFEMRKIDYFLIQSQQKWNKFFSIIKNLHVELSKFLLFPYVRLVNNF